MALRSGADLGPVFRGEFGDVLVGVARQAGQRVMEVGLGVDALAAAGFYDGVEDGAFLSSSGCPDEEPVLSDCGRTNGIFNEVMPPPRLCRAVEHDAAYSKWSRARRAA